MALRSIENKTFANERVLVRVDFNVELEQTGEVQEHFRFDIVKRTIDHISAFSGTKVALLTHFGRPAGKDMEFSTEKIRLSAEKAIGKKIVWVEDCIGEKVSRALDELRQDEILLLENVRFYNEEEENDITFAEKLAAPFSVFVNEAFSVCHRAHASVVAITGFLPSYAGLRLMDEIRELDRVRQAPDHPAIAIIGGAKIETKLPLIQALANVYDRILVGGKIANEAIDEKISFSEKVLLPQDFNSADRLDIGPNTIAYYSQIIATAKTIVWNGPMGKFEEKPNDIGTGAILQAILDSQAYVVIGGGESLAALENLGATSKISFVSSGGGAMLEYMSDKKLPGLLALDA